MIKYPIGIQTFSNIREEQYVYVDKTQYVYELANTKKYVFLSRPRRFGKSLLTSTFHAYFSGQKELFKGLAIEQLEKEWKQYPVLHFSLSTAKRGTVEDLDNVIATQLKWAEKDNGLTANNGDITTRMGDLVKNLYAKTREKVVILIDEYDAPLLTVLHDKERLEAIRTELQSFYSPLKDLDPYLRFVFITGISKLSMLTTFGPLNNFFDISMLQKYATLCGFTRQELESNFQEGINSLAERLKTTKDDIIHKLDILYGGYRFAAYSTKVYNPFYLLSAMNKQQVDNNFLAECAPDFLGKMKEEIHTDPIKIDGINVFAQDIMATIDNTCSIVPQLYQSGYITIKDYDQRSQCYTLGIPNKQVKVGINFSTKERTITEWKTESKNKQ